MTISEMHDYFDLLLDKVGTSYFRDEERDCFINAAQLEYVKRALPSNEGGVVNIEENQLVTNNLTPLIFETAGLNMNGSGVVTRSAVQTALNTSSGSTEDLAYVLNVSLTSGSTSYPVRYTRHNDWYELGRNRYKRGSSTRPRYKADATNFTFSPVDQTSSIKFTLLKKPKDVNRYNDVDCELPAHTHKTIVETAVELAAVALREGNLNQLNQPQLNG